MRGVKIVTDLHLPAALDNSPVTAPDRSFILSQAVASKLLSVITIEISNRLTSVPKLSHMARFLSCSTYPTRWLMHDKWLGNPTCVDRADG